MRIETRSQSFQRPRLGAVALNATNSAKDAMKRLRASQPFNIVATSVVKWLLSAQAVPSPFIVKHLHRVGLVCSRLPNGRMLKLESRADDWVSNQVYWRGWLGYEPESASLFFRLASRARITFDIGAY